MNTSRSTTETLTGSLTAIEQAPLKKILRRDAERVQRRILADQPGLDVAAFNSAI